MPHLIFGCPVYYWRMLSDTSPYLWLSRLLLACAVKYLTLSFAALFTIEYWCMLSNASLYVWLSRLLLSIGVCCQMHHLIFDCPVYYCKIPHAVSLVLPFTIGVCCKIHHLIFDSQVYYWHMLECAVKYITLSLTVKFTIGICWSVLSNTPPYLWQSRLLLAYAGVCCQIHHLIFDWPVYYWHMLSNTPPYLRLARPGSLWCWYCWQSLVLMFYWQSDACPLCRPAGSDVRPICIQVLQFTSSCPQINKHGGFNGDLLLLLLHMVSSFNSS